MLSIIVRINSQETDREVYLSSFLQFLRPRAPAPIYWYRSKVLARYISVEKDTVSLYGGVIAKPSRAKGERPWWNRKYISYFAFVLQLER